MALELTPADVLTFTGVTVTANDILVAAAVIDDQTGCTVDEHVDDRLIPSVMVRTAWAMCSAKVATIQQAAGSGAISTETQGDYSYSEVVELAKVERYALLTSGRVSELLGIARGVWSHV